MIQFSSIAKTLWHPCAARRRASARGVSRLIAALLACWASADLLRGQLPDQRPAVTPKLLRYAERIVRRYDADGDGQLSLEEARAMNGKPALADGNRDGQITIDEFADYVARFGAGRAIRLTYPGDGPLAQDQPAAAPLGAATSDPALTQTVRDPRRDLKYSAPLPAGVPGWFVERDADGDGQLSLAEFAPKLLKSEIAEFARYDANRDGLMTAAELLRAGNASGSEAVAPAETPRP